MAKKECKRVKRVQKMAHEVCEVLAKYNGKVTTAEAVGTLSVIKQGLIEEAFEQNEM
jgi:hypothetical protein